MTKKKIQRIEYGIGNIQQSNQIEREDNGHESKGRKTIWKNAVEKAYIKDVDRVCVCVDSTVMAKPKARSCQRQLSHT